MGVEDYRVKVGWAVSPKRKRLHNALGANGVLAIMDLWGWCAQNRTDADLSDMDAEDVEMAANWAGPPGALIKVLISEKIRLLDRHEGGYRVHDWKDHNGWAVKQEGRRGKGTKGGKASALSRRKRMENLTQTKLSSNQIATKTESSSNQIEPVVQHAINPLPSPSLPSPSFPFPSLPEFNQDPATIKVNGKDLTEDADTVYAKENPETKRLLKKLEEERIAEGEAEVARLAAVKESDTEDEEWVDEMDPERRKNTSVWSARLEWKDLSPSDRDYIRKHRLPTIGGPDYSGTNYAEEGKEGPLPF